MKKSIVFLALSILFFTNALAQQNNIDSLKLVINTTTQDTIRIKTYLKLGDVFEHTESDTALLYYQNALTIAEKSNQLKLIAQCSYYIGLIYMDQNNYSKALEHFQKALKINEEIGNQIETAANQGKIGVIYYDQGNYSNAIEYHQKALKINKKVGNKDGIAVNHTNIGNAHIDLSNYPKALQHFQKALAIDKETGNLFYIAMDNGSIALAYMDQGNYPKALEHYQKALRKFEQIEAKRGIAMTLGNLGILYSKQKNYTSALEHCQKALKIGREIENQGNIAGYLANLGTIYANQSNNLKALECLEEALKINKKTGNKVWISNNLGSIGAIYFDQGNYPKALEYYQKGLMLAEEIGHKSGAAINLGNIGQLYHNKNEHLTAINYLNKALKINQEIGIVKLSNYRNLSNSHWALNNQEKAANYLDTLINNTNKNILLNFSILPESAKQLYFTGVENDYWRYNSFVLHNPDSFPEMNGRVYNSTVKNKGLLLKSNTAMRNAIYSSKDSTLIKDYDNWIVLKHQIAKKYSNGEDDTILNNKADSLEGNLVKKSEEFSDFKKTQNIDWKQVQNRLQENEVAIEFTHFPILNPDSSYIDFTNEIQYVALVITKRSTYPKMIPLFKEKQLEEVIGKFGGNNYSYINDIYGTRTKENKALYNLVWKPIEEHLTDIKKVYLSPSGLLHKISFSAISKSQNVYLCDAFDIEVKSSTGTIILTGNHKHDLTTASLFGGINYDTDETKQIVWKYLEGAKTETNQIDKLLTKGKFEVNYFSSTNATEEQFKETAVNSNIIHIATHGFFYPDPDKVQVETESNTEHGDITFRGGSGFGVNSFVENRNPMMRSGLVLSGANDVWSQQTKNDSIEDGVLTAQEVSNIDLRKTELVVMSACESGLGDIQGSEGVYGLQRSFKMAGVDFIIMSLWQVPDKETGEFMTLFYKKLTKTIDIKEAFSQSQKIMRKKYDPFFWAAFVLVE